MDLPDNFPGYVIPRQQFDHALVRKAQQAGARLEQEAAAIGMERIDSRRVNVKATQGRHQRYFQTPLIITADGGQGSFSRWLGLCQRPPDAVAVRQYFSGARGSAGTLGIHWEPTVTPGYGWIFQGTDGMANVGIGMFTHEVRKRRLSLRDLLRRFVENNPTAQAVLAQAKPTGPIGGHPLRMDADRVDPILDNVLACGEAAGVVHPMTGEGIAPAMVCGRMAAFAALEALERGDFSIRGLGEYRHRFKDTFRTYHRIARGIRALTTNRTLLSRQLHRAQRDRGLGTTLGRVIAGVGHPATLLTPWVIGKTIAG